MAHITNRRASVTEKTSVSGPTRILLCTLIASVLPVIQDMDLRITRLTLVVPNITNNLKVATEAHREGLGTRSLLAMPRLSHTDVKSKPRAMSALHRLRHTVDPRRPKDMADLSKARDTVGPSRLRGTGDKKLPATASKNRAGMITREVVRAVTNNLSADKPEPAMGVKRRRRLVMEEPGMLKEGLGMHKQNLRP